LHSNTRKIDWIEKVATFNCQGSQTGEEVRSDLFFYVKPFEISLLANIPKKEAVPESCIPETASLTEKNLLL
jgi:hypothetical protein